jgi:hypothetical protein
MAVLSQHESWLENMHFTSLFSGYNHPLGDNSKAISFHLFRHPENFDCQSQV